MTKSQSITGPLHDERPTDAELDAYADAMADAFEDRADQFRKGE